MRVSWCFYFNPTQITQNSAHVQDLLVCACAVGVATCFAAPVGGKSRPLFPTYTRRKKTNTWLVFDELWCFGLSWMNSHSQPSHVHIILSFSSLLYQSFPLWFLWAPLFYLLSLPHNVLTDNVNTRLLLTCLHVPTNPVILLFPFTSHSLSLSLSLVSGVSRTPMVTQTFWR